MTTRATFDFRGIEDAAAGASLEDVRTLVAGPELPGLLPPGTIGAQTALQGAGIPMSAIRRGLLGPLKGRVGDYSVTSLSYAELDPVVLAGTLVCTGRPVRIDISTGANRGGANLVFCSATMDGVEVSGKADGLCWAAATGDLFLTGWTIVTPRPGPRRFAFVAKVGSAGTATLYSNAADDLQLAVCEL